MVLQSSLKYAVVKTICKTFTHFYVLYASVIRECLKLTIVNSQDPEVSCPDNCDSKLLDREIKEVSENKEKCTNLQTASEEIQIDHTC